MNTGTQNLVTTNVRIPKEDLFAYRQYALERGKSFSQLVRDVLSQAVSHVGEVKITSARGKSSLVDITKIAVKGGDPKASQSIDKYTYTHP